MLKIDIPENAWKLRSIDVLSAPSSSWNKNPQERAEMTLSCRDTDYLPKVQDAGETKTIKGVEAQVMHNGLCVKKNGYQGEWQAEIIKGLKGNHEPQEEKVFYEVIKRLSKEKSQHVIMELGSWWSYYSLWFLKDVPQSRAICCEPDPINLKLGQENAKLNGFKLNQQIIFYEAAAGSHNGKRISFTTEDKREVQVKIRAVDSLMEENSVGSLDILHMDIQGAEMAALKGAIKSIKSKKVRFLFVSTHHYAISGDPIMHQKCMDFIKSNGGYIVSSHTILESCSGDGLIVASFSEEDRDFKVEISLQPTSDSLFREAEIDTAILWNVHDTALEEYGTVAVDMKNLQNRVEALLAERQALEEEVAYLRNLPIKEKLKFLGTHVRGAAKNRIVKIVKKGK